MQLRSGGKQDPDSLEAGDAPEMKGMVLEETS